MIVFNLGKSQTLEDALRIHQRIVQLHGNQAPIILVGTKSDLRNQRQVKSGDAKAIAKRLSCRFIEASAKDRDLTENAFMTIIREAIKMSQPAKPSKRSFWPFTKKAIVRT